jgi:hypothetical protein
MIVTVTSSRSFTRTRIVLRSRRPSPSGEKFLTRWPTWTTRGALLSRWATKKAAKVAPTSSTNTARAARVTES